MRLEAESLGSNLELKTHKLHLHFTHLNTAKHISANCLESGRWRKKNTFESTSSQLQVRFDPEQNGGGDESCELVGLTLPRNEFLPFTW